MFYEYMRHVVERMTDAEVQEAQAKLDQCSYEHEIKQVEPVRLIPPTQNDWIQ